jgi:hypothetical protein
MMNAVLRALGMAIATGWQILWLLILGSRTLRGCADCRIVEWRNQFSVTYEIPDKLMCYQ